MLGGSEPLGLRRLSKRGFRCQRRERRVRRKAALRVSFMDICCPMSSSSMACTTCRSWPSSWSCVTAKPVVFDPGVMPRVSSGTVDSARARLVIRMAKFPRTRIFMAWPCSSRIRARLGRQGINGYPSEEMTGTRGWSFGLVETSLGRNLVGQNCLHVSASPESGYPRPCLRQGDGGSLGKLPSGFRCRF